MFDDNTETKEEERWQAATAAPQNMTSFLIGRDPSACHLSGVLYF